MKNNLTITVPQDVLEAARIPPGEREKEFLKELALGLYARDILSFGKARELARMSKWEFTELLGERKITRHYTEEDLDEDLKYAHGH